MFRLFVLLLAVTCSFGGLVRRPLPDGRIVGGRDAQIEEVPWQLSLRSNGNHICGASIINENWAVTAAHCVQGASAKSLSLKSGSNNRNSGGTVHSVEMVKYHEQYDPYTIDYDVAVLKVIQKFAIGSNNTEAIKLADKDPTEGTLATVSGWGTLTSGSGSLPIVLQLVSVPVVSRSNCREAYGVASISDRMVCAGYEKGGKDACQGDSGGPLVANNQLVGIVSWGYGCAYPNYPGVYSNVAALRDWVLEKIKS